MPRSLPRKPDIDQLREQAKDLLKAHQNGDAEACRTLRLLRRFADISDREILSREIALHDAQYALAMDYGFSSWNALVHHVGSMRSTKRAAGLKREESRVWIDGIPKLSWRESGGCTFAGALAAALSITEHPYSYSQIMGYTGLAFRVRWYRRTDVHDWCPSSPVGEFPDEIRAVQRATGWQFHITDTIDDPRPDAEQRSHEIIASIDGGLPVLGHPNDLDVAILYGYEHRDGDVFFVWNTYNHAKPLVLGSSEISRMIFILNGHTDPLDETERLIHALTSASWRRHSWVPADYPEPREHSYLYGDSALGRWIEDIKDADSFPADEKKKLFFVSWWCFSALCDARAQAALFLEEHAPLFEGDSGKPLLKAADIYGRQARQMEQGLRDGSLFMNPWTGNSIDNWTPDVRLREAELLSEVRRLDASAVRELDRAVSLRDELAAKR